MKQDVWIPAICCLSFGASGVYYCSLPVTQIFKGKVELATSIYICAFDSSPLIFILYQTINSYTNWKLNSFFIWYNVIPFFVLILALIFPTEKEQFGEIDLEEENKQESEKDSLLGNEEEGKKQFVEYSGHYENSDFKTIFKVPFLYFLGLVFLVHVTFFTLYMGSIEFRMNKLTTDEELSKRLVIIYSYIMPASFVLSPLIGYLLDKKGNAVTMIICHLIILSWCVCIMIEKWPYFQIVSFCLYSFGRPLFFTVILSTIPKVFGFQKMGRIIAIISTLGAPIVFVQYALVDLTVKKLDGNWLIPNLIQLGFFLVCSLFLISVWKMLRNPPKTF